MYIKLSGRKVAVSSIEEARVKAAQAAAKCKDHFEWAVKGNYQGMVYTDDGKWVRSFAFDGTEFTPVGGMGVK